MPRTSWKRGFTFYIMSGKAPDFWGGNLSRHSRSTTIDRGTR